MEQLTEYERLNRALSIYRDAMRRHIAQTLVREEEHSNAETDWFARRVIEVVEETHSERLRRERSKNIDASPTWCVENLLDIPHFLTVITGNNGFRQLAQPPATERMVDISEMRNRWAHPLQDGFRKAEVDRTIHRCADVLRIFDQEAAAAVMGLSTAEMQVRANVETFNLLKQVLEGVEVIRGRQMPREALHQSLQSIDTGNEVAKLNEAMSALVRAWEQHTEVQAEQREAITAELSALRTELESERARRSRPLIDQWFGDGTATRLSGATQTLWQR